MVSGKEVMTSSLCFEWLRIKEEILWGMVTRKEIEAGEVRNELAMKEEMPFQRNPEAMKMLELNKRKIKDIDMPFSALVGSKRKLESNLEKDSTDCSTKRNAQEWRCTLCKISTTCESNLEIHFQGKKHKKAQSEATAENKGESSVDCSSTKVDKSETDAEKKLRVEELKKRFGFICLICDLGCHTEEVFMDHCNGKSHAKKLKLAKSRIK